jgi:hypothetical protein
MAENVPFMSHGRPKSTRCQSHYSHTSVSSSQGQLFATVGVEHVVGREHQQYAVESLLVNTQRSARRNI